MVFLKKWSKYLIDSSKDITMIDYIDIKMIEYQLHAEAYYWHCLIYTVVLQVLLNWLYVELL